MNRRQFVVKSSQAAALLAVLPNISCMSMNSDGIFKEFGIQLWTLRDIISKDPKGTIQQIAKMGFTQIESYEGEKGIFWGMKPNEFKSFLSDQGLTFLSSHCNWKENVQEKAAQVASIGGKYLICPWLGPQKTIDDYKRFADEFNQTGEVCKKEGVKFVYHNHDYTFKEVEGQVPQDIFMDFTDADLVDFELDLYWVVTAGVDPIEYMTKYKNRFSLCHIKDRNKNSTEPFDSCTLGEGMINYVELLAKAKDLGMKHFIYEQEKYDAKGVLANAETSANYLKKLQINPKK